MTATAEMAPGMHNDVEGLKEDLNPETSQAIHTAYLDAKVVAANLEAGDIDAAKRQYEFMVSNLEDAKGRGVIDDDEIRFLKGALAVRVGNDGMTEVAGFTPDLRDPKDIPVPPMRGADSDSFEDFDPMLPTSKVDSKTAANADVDDYIDPENALLPVADKVVNLEDDPENALLPTPEVKGDTVTTDEGLFSAEDDTKLIAGGVKLLQEEMAKDDKTPESVADIFKSVAEAINSSTSNSIDRKLIYESFVAQAVSKFSAEEGEWWDSANVDLKDIDSVLYADKRTYDEVKESMVNDFMEGNAFTADQAEEIFGDLQEFSLVIASKDDANLDHALNMFNIMFQKINQWQAENPTGQVERFMRVIDAQLNPKDFEWFENESKTADEVVSPQSQAIRDHMAIIEAAKERMANGESTGAFKNRVKRRLKAVVNVVKKPLVMAHWKMLLGNSQGEKAGRNVLVAASLGVITTALVVAAMRKGVDISPFDGDGFSAGNWGATGKGSLETPQPIGDNPPSIEDGAPKGNGGVAGGMIGEQMGANTPAEFGVDLNTDMPWDVAHSIAPGHERELLESAMEAYSAQTGLDVQFTGANNAISAGGVQLSPAQLPGFNELLFNQR